MDNVYDVSSRFAADLKRRFGEMTTCEECLNFPICEFPEELPCILWHKIPCPMCAGRLSGIRTNGSEPVRHCFSCNFDFPIDEFGNAVRREV